MLIFCPIIRESSKASRLSFIINVTEMMKKAEKSSKTFARFAVSQ